MQNKGLQKVCDRCGKVTFYKLVGKDSFDGGYTSKDKFEAGEEGWEYTTVKGTYHDLCPKCAQEWRANRGKLSKG